MHGVPSPRNSVPRAPVWTHARRLVGRLPTEEFERMGGHVYTRVRNRGIGATLPDTIPRHAARRLLGEAYLDRVVPEWGEHRAALSGDPDAHQHDRFTAWGATSPSAADDIHDRMVAHYGSRQLAEALRGRQ